MSYRGLGAEPCKIKRYDYDSTFPQLSDGKGCPAGMSPVTHDLGVTGKENGENVCTTRVSCIWGTSTTPPLVIAPPVSPPWTKPVEKESFLDSYGGILLSMLGIGVAIHLARKYV
jgi:hypothetical protein